jgi:hypothetical protein
MWNDPETDNVGVIRNSLRFIQEKYDLAVQKKLLSAHE